MSADRCPVCDRIGTNCPTLEVMVRSTKSGSEARAEAIAAMRDCAGRAVVWRERAIAAEVDAAKWRVVKGLIEAVRASMDADPIVSMRRMFETWGDDSRAALATIDALLAATAKEPTNA